MATGKFADIEKTESILAPLGDAAGKFADTEKTESILAPLGDAATIEQRAQGRTREIIAVWLLGLLCVLVGLAFTAYFLDYDSVPPNQRFANLKTLLDVLVGPIITLLSSAIGFYFGSRSAQPGVPGSAGRPGPVGATGVAGPSGTASGLGGLTAQQVDSAGPARS